MVVPSAQAAAMARIGIFVDHRGRAVGRDVDGGQGAGADAEVGDGFAGFDPAVQEGDVGAHLDQGVVEAGAARVHADIGQGDVGAGADQGRDGQEGGGAGVGRDVDRAAGDLRLAGDRDGERPPSIRSVLTVAPKWVAGTIR